MRFANRYSAGRLLAAELAGFDFARPIVLAIPRGGVVVGFEVASALGAPLDVLVVRKLGVPPLSGYAIGAVAEGNALVTSEAAVARMGVDAERLEAMIDRERAGIERKVIDYRQGAELIALADRTVLVVDDGVATGRTATAAARALSSEAPERLVLAVPVGPPNVIGELREIYDDVICLFEPANMESIGTWYSTYGDTSELEVRALLTAAAEIAATDNG